MRKYPYIQTSVFIDDRYQFSGNQLATFWDKDANLSITDEEMQGIALELNFSETTFIFESEIDSCSAKVRIFTPGRELDFAGHPTLGTAFVLKKRALIPHEKNKLVLELGIGLIEVEFFEDHSIGMYQPEPKFMAKYEDKESLAKIIGLKANDILDDYPMQVVSTGFPFLIIPIKSLEAIQKINLNPQLQLEILNDFVTSKLLVFTTETIHKDSNVHVRMFAPSVGVLEDPATGSAAGPMGAYLEHWNVLENHTKSTNINIEQGYEIKRPSQLIVKNLYTKSEISNVLVSGKVKKIAVGDFYL
ncbi:MAG: PhzF family phenazine biosynthesis protein [Candidatus Heimdallarchaeota archaeon]|nr:PhzF family phenazine biosynthesis protein [Candidatus Heimdallarchaeota archaeon]MBY8995063.1 PhzF family phenazine biosynthesis protein [Candidatus Heimdallarchaeota archaeon]